MTSVLDHRVYSLSASSNIIGVIKSKRLRRVEHVVRTRDKMLSGVKVLNWSECMKWSEGMKWSESLEVE
jgi:hypothetical protein